MVNCMCVCCLMDNIDVCECVCVCTYASVCPFSLMVCILVSFLYTHGHVCFSDLCVCVCVSFVYLWDASLQQQLLLSDLHVGLQCRSMGK